MLYLDSKFNKNFNRNFLFKKYIFMNNVTYLYNITYNIIYKIKSK